MHMHDYERLIPAISSICMLHRTRMAARALSRHYQRFLRDVDLTGSQFALLVTLAATPEQSIAALSHEVGMDPTTVVRAVQQLERRGLVRAEGGQGRQAKRSTVTPAGHRVLRKAVPQWKSAHDTVVKALGGEAPARSVLGVIKDLETTAGALLAPARRRGLERARTASPPRAATATTSRTTSTTTTTARRRAKRA